MKFESLGFDVSSNKLFITGFNLKETDWLETIEPDEKHCENVTAFIYGETYDAEDKPKRKKIGFICGTLFNVQKAEDYGEPLYEIFDSFSQSAISLFASLKVDDMSLNPDYVGIRGNVFLVDCLFIEEKYRNRGYGTKTLDMLGDVIEYSLNCSIGCIAAIPVAIEKSKDQDLMYETLDDNKLNDKVKRFLKNAGFETIPNSRFMFINTDYNKKETIIIVK